MKSLLSFIKVLTISLICYATEGSANMQNFAANPLTKPGWDLVVNDEFNGTNLNENLWIPDYFPGRFNTPFKAYYYFKDGAIHLNVNDPEIEYGPSGWWISSLQTFSCYNLITGGYDSPEKDVPTINKFTQLYGWYEIRAMQPGPMHHIAFWMFEARPLGNEIDVTEDPEWPGPNWHTWSGGEEIWPNSSTNAYDAITTPEERANYFHLYALEVFPGGARIYHDNQLIQESEVDWKARGEMPLMFFLSIYGSKSEEDRNVTQEYIIDYFRAYKRTVPKKTNIKWFLKN